MLKKLAEVIWNILTSDSDNCDNNRISDFFIKGYNSLSAATKQKVQAEIKDIVQQINRYKIEDEKSILFLFRRRINLLKHNFTATEANIVSELVKNPKISNREIGKRYNLSEVWVSKTKNKLIKEQTLVPTLMIDPHNLGFAHKIILLNTFPDTNELLLSILSNNPYIIQIEKVLDTMVTTKQSYYLVSLFVPMKYKKIFDNWFSSLYRYKIVRDIVSLDIQKFEHSINTEAFKEGKWLFNGITDAFFFWNFLKIYKNILPSSKSFVSINYGRNVAKNKINYVYLVLLSELLKNPFLSFSKLQMALQARNIKISKSEIKNIRENILSQSILYFNVRHSELDSRISLLIWEPFIQKEVSELFQEYIEHFPQSEVYISIDGLYSIIDFPSIFYKDVRFSLTRIKEKFDNLFLFDLQINIFKRLFSDIVTLWDTKTNCWTINDSILPNIKRIISA